MSGKASSSQPNVGYGGSGALSHAYIQYPPLRCHVPGSKGLFYDDGNKLLISPTADQVFSWKTSSFNPLVAPTSDLISDGPVLSVRYSLDAKVLAIQRSTNEIQFWNRETGDSFIQRCRVESESILGFFWTDSPTCDIVFVKPSGLDLFSVNVELKALQLVESKRVNVSWYLYTHESRLLLLASGMQCKNFCGYQLSSAGIIRLPKFEMAMAKSEANSKPVLAAEDVHIVTVYGRIYCLQIDRVAMVMHSYRFYRDAVVPQGSLPIYSSKIAVSVVDNVLLLHQADAKVVIIYDIFADSQAPISAPLPLLFRGYPGVNTSSHQFYSRDTENSGVKGSKETEAIIYGDEWTFLVPDLICDVANRLLWKVQLDLEAISASSSEIHSMLEFLQRRKLEASKAKQLCLAIMRGIILERRPVSIVANAVDVLVTSYLYSIRTGTFSKGVKAEKASSSDAPRGSNPGTIADQCSRMDSFAKYGSQESSGRVENESIKTFSASESEENARSDVVQNNSRDLHLLEGNNPLSSNSYEQQESQVTSAAISPDEIYSHVFAMVEEEMAGESSFLVAIIVEFLRRANAEKIKVHPNVYVLIIQLLARNERFAELGSFVINKIIEPSKEVALQLLDSGRQDPQTRKLGLDMLRQLSLHHDYVLLLVQDGYYLEALRYARKNKVNTVRPSLFLEAAYAANDSQHLAAVLRFFSDFIPGFRNTSDYETYHRVLSEINTTVAAEIPVRS